jgi:hypothetical protein
LGTINNAIVPFFFSLAIYQDQEHIFLILICNDGANVNVMVDGCKSWGGGIVFVGVPQKIRGGMKLVRKKR